MVSANISTRKPAFRQMGRPHAKVKLRHESPKPLSIELFVYSLDYRL
jgi:hypothetical protein